VPFAPRPDARIWWEQSGTGDPVLLVMGHAYGAGMWHRTIPGLAASYRVIRFDNRGVGRSSDPPGPYPVPLMADDALAVLDAAGAASAHVYGVSLGGAIALQLALDHPGRVRSLILGCTAASAGGVPRGALLTRVRSVLPAAALNRMAWKLLYGPGTPAVLRAEDQQIVRRTRCSGRGRRGQLAGAAGFDVTGRLAEIGIPALVLHGARDRIVPAASARRLAGGIAGARLVMFPDAGHAYITDVAQAANRQVLRFLAGLPGPAGGPGAGARPAASKADTAANGLPAIRRLRVDVQAADPRSVRRDHAERACHGQGRSGAGGHRAVGPPHHQPQAPGVAQPQRGRARLAVRAAA